VLSAAIGSSDRLPAGHDEEARTVREQQVLERRRGQEHPELVSQGATFTAIGPPRRARASTIGRAGGRQRALLAASTCTMRRRSASDRAITAKGLSGGCLRARRRPTAAEVRVDREQEAARRLDRDDPAAREAADGAGERRLAQRGRAPRATKASCGPQRDRRSARRETGGRCGSSYSRRHARQSANGAIVVDGGRTGRRARS
jgi:hypothetical protein